MRNLEKVKEYFIETIKNTNDIDELLGRVYSAIQAETRYQGNLEEYGYNLLSEQFDILLDEGFEFDNEYDLSNELFTYPRMNGSLTFNTMKAERELLSIYNLDEIADDSKFEYCRNTEQMHIEACEEAFRNEFSEYLENIQINFPELDEREELLLTCYAISDDKDLDLGINLDNEFCKDTLEKAKDMNKEELELIVKVDVMKELKKPKNKEKSR